MRASPSPAGSAATKRVLVAEDDALQRRLTARLLEVRGHRVTAVADGEEAVERFAPKRFDLVLLDLEMERLGGLDAALAIRRREGESGAPPTPLFALTAHDVAEAESSCREAGFDGCLGKPLDADALDRLLAGAPAAAATRPAPVGDAVDWDAALDAVNGDRALLARIVAAARVEAPRQLERARHALGDGDADEMRRALHTLQGALRIFGDTPAVRRTLELQTLARDGELAPAPELLESLAGELRLQTAALAAGPPADRLDPGPRR